MATQGKKVGAVLIGVCLVSLSVYASARYGSKMFAAPPATNMPSQSPPYDAEGDALLPDRIRRDGLERYVSRNHVVIFLREGETRRDAEEVAFRVGGRVTADLMGYFEIGPPEWVDTIREVQAVMKTIEQDSRVSHVGYSIPMLPIDGP